jgi:hypothetical protein
MPGGVERSSPLFRLAHTLYSVVRFDGCICKSQRNGFSSSWDVGKQRHAWKGERKSPPMGRRRCPKSKQG